MSEQAATHPKISIITVVYNGEAHIAQAMQSVLDQNYPNLEYIVIDGASTDGTLAIAQGFDSASVYITSEKDSGIYNAMNKGIAQATGELIGILNADDFYRPNTLKTVAEIFSKGESDIIYGNIEKLRSFDDRDYYREEKPNLDLMEKTMGIFHPATFVAKKVYDEIGGFDEQYRLSADYDFCLRAYLKKYRFTYVDEVLTVFRIGGASTMDCRSYEEGYRILKHHNSPHADEMKALIAVCQSKSRKRKLIHTLARMLFMEKALERRIERKWK